jgi:RNase H-fold protein (predicted Holliday junction resolvase)
LTDERGRALGLDLGSVRVGLALSDPLGLTAQPFGRLPGGTSSATSPR